jgi:hypothetical protein
MLTPLVKGRQALGLAANALVAAEGATPVPPKNIQGITHPEWVENFNDGYEAGRKWAIEQRHEGHGTVSSAEIGSFTSRAVSAFLALRTGRLPSLTPVAIDEHMTCAALRQGFRSGVRAITMRGRAN